jgi:CRP-like cAMP-binding protein
MMVDEGEVKAPTTQKKGFVFNKEGFANKTPSRETIVATEFVSIWAISLRDLEDLAKTSSKIQAILNEGLKP